MIIKTTEELQAVCDRFAALPFVTLDTEFIREKTYYPVLCLIQIASKEEAYCVDPLAEGLDMRPLFDLLQNKSVVKVFHAARQDIEIFYHLTGLVPAPLFDTQIGAMVCGFGDSVSYQQLVQDLTGVSLDKSMRYTDWSQRPLTEKQIAYALHDVTHLVNVYEKLNAQLHASGRLAWLDEEMAVLNDPRTYEVPDDTVWMKMRCHLNKPQQMHVFAKLCAWRERTAKAKNRPRRHIMKDEMLQELAVVHPTTPQDLELLRSVSSGYAKSAQAAELLSVIAEALADTPKTYETIEKKRALTPAQKNLAELMRFLLNIVSDDLGVAPKIIAGAEDIADIIQGAPSAKALTGWRLEVFGKFAQELKEGRLHFAYDPQKKKVVVLSA